jgi:beta-lactamase regulating signal transducer with metallopeptidase domain
MTGLLLDHLWQSTIFAAAAGLLTLMFIENSAAVRYWLWFAASVKFLVPFSAMTSLGTYLFHSFAPKLAPPILSDLQPAADPFSGAAPVLAAPGLALPIAQGIDWAPLLLGPWAMGFAVIVAVWLGRWLKLRAALAGASPLFIDAPMPVKSSAASLEPGLIGVWRPVLLLPRGIETLLSPPEMRAILAHENCHLRRRDNLFAVIHMVVEALFWFHPLVWWLGTRLIAERENACDEAVLSSGSDPQTYAESILKVCQFYLHSPLACASGVSGADLKKRIEAIMESKFAIRLNPVKKGLLAACAATAIAAPLALGLLTATPALVPALATAMAQVTGSSHPGTEAALRRQIEGWEKKQPVLEELTPRLAAAVLQQQTGTQKLIDSLGGLKSITFKENTENNGDVYLVTFENGESVWTIWALQDDGKIDRLLFQTAVRRSDNGPSPGVEEAVRRIQDGFLHDAPAYAIMAPNLFRATNAQLTYLERDAKDLGALKSLTFTRINPSGWDVYAAIFEHGTATFTVAPLSNSLVNGLLWTDVFIPSATAHPGTEASLRRYIESLERGQPNYDEMVPGMADNVKQQLVPQILPMIKTLGALKSIAYKGGGSQESDLYDVTFEHGKVQWFIGPLDADGKVTYRGFREIRGIS